MHRPLLFDTPLNPGVQNLDSSTVTVDAPNEKREPHGEGKHVCQLALRLVVTRANLQHPMIDSLGAEVPEDYASMHVQQGRLNRSTPVIPNPVPADALQNTDHGRD